VRYARASLRIAGSAGHPRRRAANCASLAGLKRIGHPTPVRKALWNVAIKRRIASKLVADAPLRVENKNRDSNVVSDCFHYGCEISVARNENEAVSLSFVCVTEHCIRDVHIGHLFRDAPNFDASVVSFPVAGRAWLVDWREEFGLFTVSTFYDFDQWTIGKCGKVLALPLCMALVGGSVNYARCEIFYGCNCVVGIKKFCGERSEVKPFVGRATELSIVKIAAVNVNDCAFHLSFLEVQEPGLLPAPRRLPESRRVKRPVIGGNWYCTKFQA